MGPLGMESDGHESQSQILPADACRAEGITERREELSTACQRDPRHPAVRVRCAMSIFRRVVNTFSRSKLHQEIDAEIQSHVEMRTADNIAAGMSPEEARRDALIRFGSRVVMRDRKSVV